MTRHECSHEWLVIVNTAVENRAMVKKMYNNTVSNILYKLRWVTMLEWWRRFSFDYTSPKS